MSAQGLDADEIPGTMLISFSSPDPRFHLERIYAYFDGVAYTVTNYACSKADGRWSVGMVWILGPQQLEAIQRIKPLHVTGGRLGQRV